MKIFNFNTTLPCFVRTAKHETECAVCLDKVKVGIELDCKHRFHDSCIFQSLTTGPNGMRCPTCRNNVVINNQPGKTKIEFYEYLTRAEPESAKWHNNLAISKIESGKKGFDHLLKAIELDNSNFAIWVNIVKYWPNSGGKKVIPFILENGERVDRTISKREAVNFAKSLQGKL